MLLAHPSKPTAYDKVCILLNRISLAYVKYAGRLDRKDEVIVYTTPHNQLASGDYLGAVAKADWISFLADLATLKATLKLQWERNDAPPKPERNPNRDLAPEPDEAKQWSQILGISEGKPDPGELPGQFLWYLSAVKRYRCDLDTVHGFNLQGDDLFLASLNACGAWLSDNGENGKRCKIDLWVAHIVLLYNTYTTRDTSFSLHPTAEDSYVRWDVSLATDDGPENVTVAPFNAAHCPGRMTWVGFQLGGNPSSTHALYHEPVAGFFKTSWQDSSSVFNERQLLDIAHGYARPAAAHGDKGKATVKPPAPHEIDWLPGLARHWPQSCRRDNLDKAIGMPGQADGIRRVKEIIHLASVGEPLSACNSSSQLLGVIFDAIGTHGQLLKRGIIHRDISWFNVLCNGWHHPSTGGTIRDDYLCAEFVLTGKASQRGSLLIDLDHGALMETIYSAAYAPRKERTGTPMFVAIELSSKSGVPCGVPNAALLDSLVEKLRSIEDHHELFERAFPDDDGSFMTKFIAVIEKEKARNPKRTIKTNSSSPHLPRHDIESFYWILLWALARACPKDCDPYGGDIDGELLDSFSVFAQNMLAHSLGRESSRPTYIFAGKDLTEILHPKLERFAVLLQDMALYLAIPWHLYDDLNDMPRDHAHIAMQRLLLLELHALRFEDAAFDVLFNPLQPRVAQVPESEIFSRQTQPTTTGLMSVLKVIAVADREARTTRYQPCRGTKRKSAEPEHFTNTQLKRAKEKQAAAESANDDLPAFDTSRNPSPGDLIRMFLDDRLWFGIGTREALKTKDEE